VAGDAGDDRALEAGRVDAFDANKGIQAAESHSNGTYVIKEMRPGPQPVRVTAVSWGRRKNLETRSDWEWKRMLQALVETWDPRTTQ
jgi:hypothetical protein